MTMELNSTVITGQLTQALTSFPDFVQFLNTAYSVPGLEVLFPLIVLSLLGIAIFNKTQNIGVTVAGVSIAYLMIAQYVPGLAALFIPVAGLLVLASAFVLWSALARG